jgi:ATP-dependent RNA helicase CshB
MVKWEAAAYNMEAMSSFSAFNLSEKMTGALAKLGYYEPSPVQSSVIPKALRGVSLLAQSETGSGKTHAFLVPIIDRIDVNLPRVQAIVIAPTRELARQIYDFAKVFERFFPHLRIRLFTSENERSQNEEGLLSAPHLVIGTPGRIKDLLVDNYKLDLHNVKTIVLDEADMLMDMGYFADIEELLKILRDPQIMVFSATLKQSLRDELGKFVKTDFEFESDHVETSSTVLHHLVDIKHVGINEALMSFLRVKNPYLCLVFASTKETVGTVYKTLKDNDFNAVYFSGSLDDRSRKKAIRDIRSNHFQIIVSSDLLSRGIDIPDVTDVISLDLPSDLEFYYHRAGRTGRFGKGGDSWVFYNADTIEGPRELLAMGVKFDYYTLKSDRLDKDPVGLAPKTKFKRKKAFGEDELKEVKIAKALTRNKRVKPAYKKKQRWAIEKVKRKYRRKAIQRSIHKQLASAFRARSAKKNGEE